MKKALSLILSIVMILSVAALVACGGSNTYEIAVVTDVGQLMDKGFNQGTYEGAKKYADDNGISMKYYQPANGSNATDDDRIKAMTDACDAGAEVIVTPGFLQATALEAAHIRSLWNERVTSRKARGLQTEEIACKCQDIFIPLKRQEETN